MVKESRFDYLIIDLSACIPLQWANIKNEVEAQVDDFIQITVFCPPRSQLDVFVYRNAGKVYCYIFMGILGGRERPQYNIISPDTRYLIEKV